MKFFLYKNTGELLRRIHHHQRGREGSSEQGSCSVEKPAGSEGIGHGRSIHYSASLKLGKVSFKAAHLRAALGSE